MSQPAVKNSSDSTTLYDGECIDLTDDTEPQINSNEDILLVLDTSKPVKELTAAVNAKLGNLSNPQTKIVLSTNKTVPNKPQQSPQKAPSTPTNNSNNIKNIVVLSNQVISPEKNNQHDSFAIVRPIGTTYQETNLEEGDIVLTPSPKEIRSKKFPIELVKPFPVKPPTVNIDNDDDVIFLSSESQRTPTPQTNPKPNPPVMPQGLSCQIPQPVQKTVPNAKPGSVMNKLSEVVSTLQSTQNEKHVQGMVVLPTSKPNTLQTPNTLTKKAPTQIQKQNLNYALKPKPLNSVQNVQAKTSPKAQPAQKVVQIIRTIPGTKSQLVVQNVKVGNIPTLQHVSKPSTSQANKNVLRTFASYIPMPEIPKKFRLSAKKPTPVLPSLEKLGITGKVEGLSREEVLKAVRATSVKDLTPVKNAKKQLKRPGKTYLKNDSFVVQNPFSTARTEESGGSVIKVSETQEADVNTSVTIEEDSQSDSSLSQILIQNVYTANDTLFTQPQAVPNDAPVTEVADEVIYLDDLATVEPILSRTEPVVVPDISSQIKPKIQPQKKTPIKPKPRNVLIDPIRGSVIYNRAIQKHVRGPDRDPFSLAEYVETVSAVAAITPDSEGNTDSTNKRDVVFLLYPIGQEDGNNSSSFQEGQLQQVLALVPSDSKLAPPTPTPEVDESEKNDFDLMPPPMIPLRRDTNVNKASVPSKGKNLNSQKVVQLDSPRIEQFVRKSSSKDRDIENAPRRSASPEDHVLESSYEESDLQEILTRLDSTPHKNFASKPSSKRVTESPSIELVDQINSNLRQAMNRLESPPRRTPVRKSLSKDIEIEPAAIVTPVDILQIINKGKKPEIKGRCQFQALPQKTTHLLGFTKRQMTSASCLKEMKSIIKREKTKITKLKKKMAEQDKSNIVYCGSATSYFLPESVKSEVDEDEMKHEIEYQAFAFDNNDVQDLEETDVIPTISQVVSKVNQEVFQMKHTQGPTRKNKAPASLSRTEEALQLIRKGLEMIQSWSQESGSEVEGINRLDPVLRGRRDEEASSSVVEKFDRRRRQVRKVGEEPVEKRRRKKNGVQKPQVKEGSVGDVTKIKINSGGAVKKKGGKKPSDDGDDDLLFVKRVDIIKHAGVAKRGRGRGRGRRKPM